MFAYFFQTPGYLRLPPVAVKRSDSLSPAPLGESPFGEDPAIAEAAGRLPMRARASLVHVDVQRRFVCGAGVLEVSGSVLEGGYCVVGVDDERQARRGGGRGVLSQGLGNPGRVVVGLSRA